MSWLSNRTSLADANLLYNNEIWQIMLIILCLMFFYCWLLTLCIRWYQEQPTVSYQHLRSSNNTTWFNSKLKEEDELALCLTSTEREVEAVSAQKNLLPHSSNRERPSSKCLASFGRRSEAFIGEILMMHCRNNGQVSDQTKQPKLLIDILTHQWVQIRLNKLVINSHHSL